MKKFAKLIKKKLILLYNKKLNFQNLIFKNLIDFWPSNKLTYFIIYYHILHVGNILSIFEL